MNEATRLRQLIDNLLNEADEIDDNGESYLHELIRITHAVAHNIPVECDHCQSPMTRRRHDWHCDGCGRIRT